MISTEALVAFFGTVSVLATVSMPVVRTWIEGSIRRKERLEDYTRQDVVAARVLEAAATVQRQTAKVADTLAAQTEQVKASADKVESTLARQSESVNNRLDGIDSGQKAIHALVNSQLTSSIQNELNTAIALDVALHKLLGSSPTAEELAVIEATDKRIKELQNIVLDRNTQTAIAAKIS